MCVKIVLFFIIQILISPLDFRQDVRSGRGSEKICSFVYHQVQVKKAGFSLCVCNFFVQNRMVLRIYDRLRHPALKGWAEAPTGWRTLKAVCYSVLETADRWAASNICCRASIPAAT